jgi:hypothetical protein
VDDAVGRRIESVTDLRGWVQVASKSSIVLERHNPAVITYYFYVLEYFLSRKTVLFASPDIKDSTNNGGIGG